MNAAVAEKSPPPPADGRSYTTTERWELSPKGWIFAPDSPAHDGSARFKIVGLYCRPYWVTFKGRPSACMESHDEEAARAEAAELTGAEALSVRMLPYPARPRLRPFEHPTYGVMPDFCLHGERCAGRGSCPRPHSCCD